MRVLSGDWVLDTQTRLIVRSGDIVHVSPKAFDLLAMLLRERPRVVSKPELLEHIWPDTIVTEANLATLVAELRSALGDDAHHPRSIRTAHRHGYAFCGMATEGNEATPMETPGSSRVRLLIGEREIALAPGAHVLGREPEAAVWVDSPRVSRRHARIFVSAAGTSVEDLGSKNGTFVNGNRVTNAHLLCDGDEIRLGSERLVLRFLGTNASTETQPD
jgi:DNA-binding winged helix-turn-helix (wHTH) protein